MKALIAKIIAIRGGASAIRLLSVLTLPFIFPREDFEKLIWIITTASIFPFFCSLEFYTYSNRRYMENKNEIELEYLLSTSLLIPAIGTLLLTPVILTYCYLSDISIGKSGTTLLIFTIYIESILNEFMRIRIAQNNQIGASKLYFLRQTILIFSIGLIYLSSFSTTTKPLTSLFIPTLFTLNAIAAIYLFFHTRGNRIKLDKSIYKYIKEGKSVITQYLASGLMSKIATNGDRIFVSTFFDSSIFATYTYLINAINGLSSFIDPLINQVLLPNLLSIRDKTSRYKICKRNLKWVVVYLCISLATLPLIFTYGPPFATNLTTSTHVTLFLLITLIQLNIYLRFTSYTTSLDAPLLTTSIIGATTLFVLLFLITLFKKTEGAQYVFTAAAAAQATSLVTLLTSLHNAKKSW